MIRSSPDTKQAKRNKRI
nr:hypothetical protein [Staphylococcus aureus]